MNREHAIDPRLGESRGVATRSKPSEQVISGKIVGSFESLVPPVSDRTGLVPRPREGSAPQFRRISYPEKRPPGKLCTS
jgi:hypothetical protein